MRPALISLLAGLAVLAGLTALSVAGCTSDPRSLPDGAQTCPTPRPQMCTRDYRPVTGFDADGNRLGSYGNHCSACGDARVIYTLPATPR